MRKVTPYRISALIATMVLLLVGMTVSAQDES